MPTLRARLGRHSVRLRLTALYGLLFLASGVALLAATYVLVEHGTGGDVMTYTTRSGHGLLARVPGSAKPSSAPKSMVFAPASSGAAPPKAALDAEAQHIRRLADRQHQAMLDQLLVDSGLALAVMVGVSCGLGWIVAGRTLRPLESSLAAQRQFVANASHELRTPLARQRAIGQVALADPEADIGSLRAAHERVLAAGAQQERLITGLLALARGQAGVDHREHLDLAVVAARVLAGRQAEAELRGVVVDDELAPAPLVGDPRLVESLTGNLIDNALRHNVRSGWVRVATACVDGRSVLTVANSGRAVPEGELPRLVEPFRRLGGGRAVHDDGSGIGLSIVRAVCEAHGADLELHARDGGGLEVRVAFAADRHPGGVSATVRAVRRAARLAK
ncbi:MAG TPA: HAMP domain-containing sensor histidine kinase [Jatrophihabitans sp.]|nr:HAMP domain-containing sensor histidine kinase [Jatrophihabitans sp.]